MNAMAGRKNPGSIAEWGQRLMANAATMSPTRPVPCGSCNACCRHPHLQADLTPEELADFPEAQPHDALGWVLPKKPNGECVHFVDGRCGIYDRRPISCRSYDCRAHLFGLQPVVSNNIDLVLDAIAMWGEWTVETAEDVDHLLAWNRAAAEAFSSAPAVIYPDVLIDLFTRYRTYLGDVRKVQEIIGFDAARELALEGDRVWRGRLTEMWRRVKFITPSATRRRSVSVVESLASLETMLPRRGDAQPIELGAAVNAIAERISSQIERLIPGALRPWGEALAA